MMGATVKILIILISAFSYIECIINGTSGLRNEFPSTVKILVESKNYTSSSLLLCSGVIINEILILTAGHCLKDVEYVSEITVIAGEYDHEHDLNDNSTAQQSREAVENYSHPFIDIKHSMRYDLAVLRLATPLIFGESIQPVSLPDEEFVALGDMTFAGWGTTSSPEDNYPEVLQKVILKIIDNGSCQKQYQDSDSEGGKDFSGALCGASGDKTSSPGGGDSGGGAFCPHGNKSILCGILSYKFDRISSSPAAVFTRIDAPIVNWIRLVNNDTKSQLDDFHRKSVDDGWPRKNNLYYIIIGVGIAICIVGALAGALFYIFRVKRGRGNFSVHDKHCHSDTQHLYEEHSSSDSEANLLYLRQNLGISHHTLIYMTHSSTVFVANDAAYLPRCSVTQTQSSSICQLCHLII